MGEVGEGLGREKKRGEGEKKKEKGRERGKKEGGDRGKLWLKGVNCAGWCRLWLGVKLVGF